MTRVIAIDEATRKAKNAERSREWRREHPGYDKRKFRNTEAWLKAKKRYTTSAKGRETNRIYLRSQRLQNALKMRARDAVKIAKRLGKLRPLPECQECGRVGILHAHHDDYSKPLDVRWLCVGCHTRLHHAA